MSNMVRLIARDGAMVCTVLDSTELVAEMERIHQPSAVVTAALGRLLTAGAIMGRMLKNEEDSITLRLAGDGPTGSLIVVSDGLGNPRGYVANPIVEIPLNQYGKLDVAGAVGKNGTLSVVKDVGLPEPSTGAVPIVSGEIAEDITNYFAVSEQTPSVCALGVLVNPDLHVAAAGGYLVQLLPGASEEEIARLEENIKDIDAVSTMIHKGMTPREIGEKLLQGFSPELLDECGPVYRCTCSKQRVERTLISIGREELDRLASEQEETEVCCHFCNKKYVFSSAELALLG